MATTIEEVKQFLNEEGKKFREIPGKNFIRTGFITDNYTDNEGEKLCSLVVAVEEDGEFLKILAPKAYQFSKDASSYNKMALSQTTGKSGRSSNSRSKTRPLRANNSCAASTESPACWKNTMNKSRMLCAAA